MAEGDRYRTFRNLACGLALQLSSMAGGANEAKSDPVRRLPGVRTRLRRWPNGQPIRCSAGTGRTGGRSKMGAVLLLLRDVRLHHRRGPKLEGQPRSEE